MSRKLKPGQTTTHKEKYSYTTSYQPEKISNPTEPKRGDRKKRGKWKAPFLLATISLLAVILTIVIWDVQNFSAASKKLFGTDNVWEVFRTQPLKRNTSGRTNMLLVGYSVDDPGHGGADLTDSILILSFDKSSHSGFMLSVPRDLYVNIPGRGMARINEAYQAGGMNTLRQVVTDVFGVDIHYSALVDYTSVKDIVNALDGIEVTIKSDDPRGIYDPNFPPSQGGPLKLANGKHLINGQTALRLTRARGEGDGSYGFPRSDFNRTQNQQQVFLAIKNKLDWSLVLDPRTNGRIFNSAGDNVKTDLKINDVIPFYRLLTDIPNGNLKPVSLGDIDGQSLLTGYVVPYSGAQVLIPSLGFNDYSAIRQAVNTLGK